MLRARRGLTSHCSTDSERPHRCCHLPTKVENIDARRIFPIHYTARLPILWGSGPPSAGYRVSCRHGTGSHFVTQRPSDPGIQRPGDPVDPPVTLFYNELQMSTYVADKSLQWARGLPVFIVVWRLHASGK